MLRRFASSSPASPGELRRRCRWCTRSFRISRILSGRSSCSSSAANPSPPRPKPCCTSCAAFEAAAPLTRRRELVRVELASRADRAVRHCVRRLIAVEVDAPALVRLEPRARTLLADDQREMKDDLVRVHESLFDKNAEYYS